MATYDLSAVDYTPKSRQLQLDATAATVTIITLPVGGGYRVTVGPIRTAAAEATTEAGACAFGDSTLAAVPAFNSATNIERRYLVSGQALEFTVTRNKNLRAVKLAVLGTTNSAVLEIAIDALDG